MTERIFAGNDGDVVARAIAASRVVRAMQRRFSAALIRRARGC